MEKISCVLVDDELNARKLLKKYISRTDCLDLIGEFNNALSLTKSLFFLKPRVIFLDVQMPGKTGIEFLEELENPDEYIIIFTTAYDEYAIKAFDKCAVDYLLKPFDEERFLKAVDKIRKSIFLASVSPNKRLVTMQDLLLQMQLTGKAENMYLEKVTCRKGNTLKIVKMIDVQYIEAAGNYIKLFAEDNYYLLAISLSEIELRLSPANFLRIHRSNIVNTSFITSISNHYNGEYNLKIKNNALLKVSRSYKEQFNKVMGVF